MTFFWTLKPGTILSLISLVSVLQLSACSTEDFANAVADNIISEPAIAANAASVTEPSPGPSPIPATSAIAMYSYSANLANAQPLSGAVLEQATVYLFLSDTSAYSSITFYCCKGISGASTGETHKAAVTDASAPYVYSIDTSQFTTTGTRELYFDATRADGTGYDNLSTNFSINIQNAPPPVTVSDISFSWTAPAEREDNTALSLSEIAGYKIYYGTSKGNYSNSVSINDGTATSHTFNNFAAGTYYFVITTRDVDGRESQYSTELSKSI